MDEKELIGEKDSIGQKMAEDQLESLKGQLKMYKSSIKLKKAQKQDYLDQVKLDDEVWQIRMKDGNHEKIDDKKSFKYELDPRFWELVRAKQEYEYRDHQARMEQTIKKFDMDIKMLKDSLKSVKEKIKTMEERE